MSNVGNNWIQKIPLTALEILAILEIFFIKLWITGYGEQVVLLQNTNYFFFLENGWEQKTRLPIVVGPVDGTHIPNYATMQPYFNSQDHYSYKMKYTITINVKGVCNYNGKFIDVDIRWPGGTH